MMPGVMSYDDPGYVDVQWNSSSPNNGTCSEEEAPSTLMFGTVAIKVFPTEAGRGIFKTSGIPVATYSVDGIVFEVRAGNNKSRTATSTSNNTNTNTTSLPLKQSHVLPNGSAPSTGTRTNSPVLSRTSVPSSPKLSRLAASSSSASIKTSHAEKGSASSSTFSNKDLLSRQKCQKYIQDSRLTTAEEAVQIYELRAILGDILTSGAHSMWPEVVGDISLTRFLRGCNHNVHQAAAKFREHIYCRQRFGFDKCRRRLGILQNVNTFEQEDVIHGDTIAKKYRMEYNVGNTQLGDPICVFWAVTGALSTMMADPSIGYSNLIEFVVETFVRRQIQLDTMSRAQGRLVRLVVVVQCSFRGWWRLFGTCHKKTIREREFMNNSIGGTLPFFAGKIHVVGLAWAMKAFLYKIPTYGSFYDIEYHGENYYNKLSEVFTPESLFATEEFYSQYDATGTYKSDAGAM